MKDVYDSFFVDSPTEDSVDLSSSSTLSNFDTPPTALTTHVAIDTSSSMTPMRYSVGSTPTKPGRTLFSILGSLEEDEDDSFAQIEEIEESVLEKEEKNEEEEEIIETDITPKVCDRRKRVVIDDDDDNDDSTTTSKEESSTEDDGESVDDNDEQSVGNELSMLSLINYDDINSVDDGSIGSTTSDASSRGIIVDCDDESVTCFDRCGIWDLDSEHKGDLLLSSDKETKWPKVRLPLIVYDKLFNHQRIGVQWMASLHDSVIGGGILADDMGLGKTMQTLAFLGSLMRAQTISNAIVVCPKSVVRSWEREAKLILKNMCVPKATVYAVTSDMSKEKRLQIFSDTYCTSVNAPRLVITTYGLVSNHITDLNSIANANSEHHWWYVILDEGHQIKNSNTKTSQDVRILSRNEKTRRLLLTGTPIQNNMRELYAIFDWATSSKLLGSIKTFMNRYGNIIEEGRQRNASEWTVKKSNEMNTELQRKLQPYFLQRLKKTEFEETMPGKKELVVFTRLSAKQRRMYSDYTEGIIFDSELSPLAAVSWLKMLCGHPSLVKEASRKYIDCDSDLLLKDSAKLKVLIDLLIRLKHSGHRTLVFSQSTKMLDDHRTGRNTVRQMNW
jgi:SNF2 family DNA or RNA helicase